MFNGLFSLIGLSWGNGSVSVSGPSEGPSYPPAGTYYDTQYGVEYPIAEGGSYTINPLDSSQVPNQVCDVDREHDGSGGIVYDWTTATNIQYKTAGTSYATDFNTQIDFGSEEVPTGSGNYFSPSFEHPTYEHDGSGGTQNGANVFGGHKPYGTYINLAYNEQYEVVPLWYVNSSAYYIDTGRYYDYIWNGNNTGYSLSSEQGNYTPQGTTFYTENSTTTFPDGNDYANGIITNFQHDGSGGHQTSSTGSYYPYGTFVYSEYVNGTQTSVEVPSGSGNYYDSQEYGNAYVWDGTGYYTSVSTWYIPSGTFIYNDGTYDYYWDGSGGYYT